LEALWARRDTGVALWERTHIPLPVREHVRALEQLTGTLCSLMFTVTVDPHEPH
jgi:hypothetical protein